MKSHILPIFISLIILITIAAIAATTTKNNHADQYQNISTQSSPTTDPSTTMTEPIENSFYQQSLAPEFPTNFPIYPGSVLEYSVAQETDDYLGFETLWETEDDVSTVASWYLDALRNADWQVTNPNRSIEGISEIFLEATSGNNLVLLTIETHGNGSTEIIADLPLKANEKIN